MPDLHAFDITLTNTTGPLPMTAIRSHSLNGLFYAELSRRDEATVQELHQSNTVAPFSLAARFENGYFTGLRIATLTADLGQRVAETWGSLAAQGATVTLGNATLQVTAIRPGQPAALTYAQLLDEAPLAHGVALRFETPLRVKYHGFSGVLPMPFAIWKSLAQRWAAFAGIDLPPEFVQWVDYRVQANALALETVYAYAEKQVEWRGIVGEIEYQANTPANDDVIPPTRQPDYLRAWQALALLAEFTGVGEKVTMGMGRTRRARVFGRRTE